MDGAMGTELQKLGLQPGENSATWNVLYPEQVRRVHANYVTAGAQVLLSNTFLLNANSYREQMAPSMLAADEFWRQTVSLMSGDVFRIAAFGPISGNTRREFDDLDALPCPTKTDVVPRRFHQRIDALLLETVSSARVQYAIRHLRRHYDDPILLSLTYRRDATGKLETASGHDPEWFARRARRYDIAALGVNCGDNIGMDDIIEVVRRYADVTDVPLFARPNAGTPKRKGRQWIYPQSPAAMAAHLPVLLEAGVSMVGGCCGTTPEHIAAFRPIIKQWNVQR
jgi:5-methyltetrahydrofolate--homocysteine methyltransferase